MSIEIDVLNGDASWKMAEPLMEAVWPPDVLAKLPWGDVVFAHADLRVLIEAPAGGLGCHVGIFFRTFTWNGRNVNIGAIGAAAYPPHHRDPGLALGPPQPPPPTP